MSDALNRFDRLVGRALLIPPPAQRPVAENVQRTRRRLSVSLAFSGVRCILQYVIFPAVLPLLGLATQQLLPVLLILSVIAAGMIVINVRRLWLIDYTHKRAYLFVALAALVVLCLSILADIRHVTA